MWMERGGVEGVGGGHSPPILVMYMSLEDNRVFDAISHPKLN